MDQFIVTYGFCALGVLISILLPIIREAIPKPQGKTAGIEAIVPRIWKITKPYLALGLFSLIVALLLVAFLKDQLIDWRAALLSGYAADSTLQKLKG